jgi:hypothetical protein
MMRLAPTRNSIELTTGGSLLLRMRAWFTAGAGAAACSAEPRGVASFETPSTFVQADKSQTAVVLPFPIREEALLVKLAERLRARIASRTLQHDSLLLDISRHSHSRMMIDRTAYVEFHAQRATYHVVVETMPDTTIRVETTDFDTVVKFVAQYIDERLADVSMLEAAS